MAMEEGICKGKAHKAVVVVVAEEAARTAADLHT
jgi:hypothetical protein